MYATSVLKTSKPSVLIGLDGSRVICLDVKHDGRFGAQALREVVQPHEGQHRTEAAALRGRIDADDVHLAESGRRPVDLRPVEAEQFACHPRVARSGPVRRPGTARRGRTTIRRAARRCPASVQPPCSGCHAKAALLTRSSSSSSPGPE